MLTFLDIQNRVYRWLDETDGTATTTQNLVKDSINASHRRLCLARSWPFLQWPRDETFTSVAAQRIYPLHPQASKVLYLWNTTRREFTTLIPRRNWESHSVDLSATNVANPGAIWGGYWPVSAQPSTVNSITAVSSVSTDVGTLHLRGLDENNDVITEDLTMDGVVGVTTTAHFRYLLNVSKSGTWTGIMTLTDAEGNTLLTLNVSEIARQHPTVEFIEDPTGGVSYNYSFIRQPRTLSNDNDIPETPFPYSEIHVYDALLDLATYNSDIDETHQRVWKGRYDELAKQLNEAMDESIVGSQPRFVRDLDGPSGHAAQWGTT